jgi:hypothetical protein
VLNLLDTNFDNFLPMNPKEMFYASCWLTDTLLDAGIEEQENFSNRFGAQCVGKEDPWPIVESLVKNITK